MLHALLDTLPETITFDTDPTHAHTTAAEAFAIKRGVCQDISHIFIASARSLGIPARYVSGYLHRADGVNEQQAGHAWAEAFVDGLGWIAFDATNGMCATDAHLRVAVGLDYLSAAPVRGSRDRRRRRRSRCPHPNRSADAPATGIGQRTNGPIQHGQGMANVKSTPLVHWPTWPCCNAPEWG